MMYFLYSLPIILYALIFPLLNGKHDKLFALKFMNSLGVFSMIYSFCLGLGFKTGIISYSGEIYPSKVLTEFTINFIILVLIPFDISYILSHFRSDVYRDENEK